MMAFPDSPIIAACGTEDLNRKFCRDIKDTIREYGMPLAGIEIDPQEDRNQIFKLKGRRRSQYLGTLAEGRSAQGQPANLIIADDLCPTAGAAASRRDRETLSEWFNSVLMSRLDNPEAKIIVVSSRRHPQDLTGELLEKNKALAPEDQWHILKLPAISRSGKALWPWRWPLTVPAGDPRDSLEKKKHELELSGHGYLWSSEWMQSPFENPNTIAFEQKLFKDPTASWDILTVPDYKKKLSCISIDPSYTRNSSTGDFTAILYTELSEDGHIIVVDSWLDIKTPPIWHQAVVDMIKQYHPDFLAIEVIRPPAIDVTYDAGVHLAKFLLQQGIIDMPVMRWEKKDGGGPDKPRIRWTLGTLLQERRIHIANNYTNRRGLQMLMTYPSASNDDFPDALEQAVSSFTKYLS